MKIFRFSLAFMFIILSSSYIFGQTTVNVSLPSTITGVSGGTITFPVNISGVSGATGIEAYQYKINYDYTQLEPLLVSVFGTVDSSFFLGYNDSSGVLSIAAAGSQTINSDGILTKITFKVKSSASGFSYISMSDLIFNQGVDPTASIPTVATFTPSIATVSIPAGTNLTAGQTAVTIPVSVSDLSGKQLTSYQIDFIYDPNILTPASYSTTGTLSENATLDSNTIASGKFRVACASANPFSGSGVLINLIFNVNSFIGTTNIGISKFFFQEGDTIAVSGGVITSSATIIFTSASSITVTEGNSFSHTFIAPGSDVSYQLIGKETWMDFNSASGVLSGFIDPTSVKPYYLTVIATDAGVTPAAENTQDFTINVENINTPHMITSFSPLNAKVGVEQTFTMTIFDTDIAYNPQYSGQYFMYRFDEDYFPYGMRIFDPSTQQLVYYTNYIQDSQIQIKWTPFPNQTGVIQTKILVYGNGGYIAQELYDISVPDNTHPTISDISDLTYSVNETFTPIQVQASDSDGNSLSYSISVSPSIPGIMISDGGLIVWANLQLGSYTVTIRVSDLTQSTVDNARNNVVLSTTEESFTINVRENTSPTIIDFPVADTAYVGASYVRAITAQDVDGDVLTFTLIEAPLGMTLSDQPILAKAASITNTTVYINWIPTSDQANSNYIVALEINDGFNIVSSTYSIYVKVDENPSFTVFPKDTTIKVGDVYTEMVTGVDPEEKTVTYTLITSPDGMTINASTGEIIWTPTSDQVREHTVKVQISDGVRTSDSTYTITVNVNLEPIITEFPIDAQIGVNQDYKAEVKATDLENEPLEFSLVSPPDGMTIGLLSGLIEWIPDQAGEYSITVQISDGVNIVERTFIITVSSEVNEAPTFVMFPQDTTIKAWVDYSVQVTATDIEGDEIIYSLITFPDGMTINSETGVITWKPEELQVAIHEVKVGVTDGISIVEQSFKIIVTAAAPEIISIYPSTGFTDEDISITVYGKYFKEGAVVTIGTTNLENVVLNVDGSLTGTLLAPVPEGVYDVKVTNPDEQFDIIEKKYNVLEPIVDVIAPVFVQGIPYHLPPTTNTAVIEWRTNELTKGYVEYGTNTEALIKIDVTEFADFHSVIIEELTSGVEYFYRVGAIDENDNGPTVSEFNSFVTKTEEDNIAPIITLFEPITMENSAVIRFKTNEDANTTILYRVYQSGAEFTELKDDKFIREHNILIIELSASTKYEYIVKSTDISGNVSEESVDEFDNVLTFETKAEADITPPIIESVRAENITNVSATIVWYTKEQSSSIVEYGLSQDYGQEVSTDATPNPAKSSHIVELVGLANNTEYHFRVISVDGSGNMSLPSEDIVFKTRETADITPPIFTVRPNVSGVTESMATVYFETNELASTVVKYREESGVSKASQEDGYKDVFDNELTDIHTITIVGLSADIQYEFIAYSTDASGNEASMSGPPFKTEAAADLTAPKIAPGGIPFAQDIKRNSAVIIWKTDEYSSSRVDYGLNLSYGKKTIGELGKYHYVYLNDLEAGKLYHYQVSSTDPSGNSFVDIDRTFTTMVDEDLIKPEIISPPVAKRVTTNTATIEWKTDEIATSFIEFRVKDGVPEKQGSSEFTREHKVDITGLVEDTDYYYKIISVDNSPNRNTLIMDGIDSPIHTLTTEDKTPPRLVPGGAPHDVNHNVVKSSLGKNSKSSEDVYRASLTIEWITNEPSDSGIDFGVDATYGSFEYSGEMVTNHSIYIDGLLTGTIYHYKVTSVDANNNIFVSKDRTFKTLEKEDIDPPKITELPYVASKTANTALVKWGTNEDADSYVRYWKVGESENVLIKGSPDATKTHEVFLTNLKENTYYQYEINSTDVSANQNKTVLKGTDSPFKTSEKDIIKPLNIILGPNVSNVTATSATVIWETDNLAISTLKYNEKDSESIITERTSEYNFIQEFALVDLSPSTEYTFSAASIDKNEVEAKSKLVKSFKTLPVTDDTTAPKLIEGPIADIKYDAASISWITDENSDSYIFQKVVDSEEAFTKIGSPDLVKEHTVIITGLNIETEYWFVVSSTDFNFNTLALFPEDYVGDKALFKSSKTLKINQPPGGTGRFRTKTSPDITNPEIIFGPVISNITKNSATVKWSTNENSNSFIYYDPKGDFSLSKGSAINLADHSITITDLDSNTTYKYKTASTDLSQNGPTYSEEMVFTTLEESDMVPPVITEGPIATSITDQEATILWDTDEPSDSYVEFGLDSTLGELDTLFGPTLSISLPKHVTEHQVTITNLLRDNTYYYRVASVDIALNGPTYSNRLSFKTSTDPDIVPPSLGDSAKVASISDKSIVIKWVTNELSDSFIEYDSTAGLLKKIALMKAGAADVELLEDVVGSSKDVFEHIVTITNLVPGTEYTFQVGSTDKSNNETVSGLQKVSSLSEPDQTPPSEPKNLEIIPGNKALMLTWSPNPESDLAGYNVYKKKDGEFVEIYSQVTDTFHIEAGLDNDSTYFYKITAIDKISPPNKSDFSEEKSGTPSISAIPTAPVGFAPSDRSIVRTDTPELTIFNSIALREPITYDFIVSTDSTFNTNTVSFNTRITEGQQVTNFTLKTPIEDKTQYFWRARAYDGYFYSDWMDNFKFTTDIITSVELVAFEAIESGGKVNISWETAFEENVLGYNILRSNSKDGEFTKINDDFIELNKEQLYQVIDENVISNTTYYYILESINLDGRHNVIENFSVKVKSPKTYTLYQNYPNPFNPITHIKFELPRRENVVLKVYNILGQEVKILIDEEKEAGFYSAKWDGTNKFGLKVSSGVYIYQIRAGKFVSAKKMLFLK